MRKLFPTACFSVDIRLKGHFIMNYKNKRIYEKMNRVVLVVEDEEINREILGEILSDEYEILYAGNGKEAYDILKSGSKLISVILLDLVMPVMDGFQLLEKIMSDAELRKIPVIVLTSDRSAEVKSLDLGAVDFITKPYDFPEVIRARVRRTVELAEDRSIISSTERDELTGLLNKPFLFQYISVMEKFHPDKKMDAAVLNISHFHTINEIYGRKFGDEILRSLAEILAKYAAAHEGLAARSGADTFLLYVQHAEEKETYNEIIHEIEKYFEQRSVSIHAHIRIGVYCIDEGDSNIEVRFDRAKSACNTLRGRFQKTVAYYDADLRSSAFFSEKLTHEMYKGLENNEFKVFFQPKYEIRGDKPRLVCAEALIRWIHPELGTVAPGVFVPLFENNGLIQKVDHFVWNQSAAKIAEWRDRYGIVMPVSVNVSRIDLYDPNIEGFLLNILRENKLETYSMHLEVTESAYADDTLQIVEKVKSLRQAGFIIEMDDFGSGYSSLNMLTSMPIDVLKMDMKFVKNIEKDKKCLRMIQLIIDIAKFMSVPVVAEGVEEEGQYRLLRESGCDIIQGYYFSKPLSAEEFEQLVKKTAEEEI